MKLPWVILVLALILPTAGALVYFVAADPDDPLFRITYAVSKIVQFALPVVVLLVLNRQRLRAIRLSSRGFYAGWAVGAVTAAVITCLYLGALRNTSLLVGLADLIRPKLTGFGFDAPAGYVTVAVFLSSAPLVP